MSKKRVFLWQNNGVAPGAIETDFGGGVVHDNGWVNAQRIEASGGMFL